MYDENDLIFSDLQQSYVANGNSVRIEIYRMPDSGWTLEVVDAHNNSTVWDDDFPTDAAALECWFRVQAEPVFRTNIEPLV